MPRPYVLHPHHFRAPGPWSDNLQISFRLNYESRDPIFPASALQVSFARPADAQEIFVAKRFGPRDVEHNALGICTIRLDPALLPRYAPLPTTKQAHDGGGNDDDGNDDGDEDDDDDCNAVVVKLHAWKGETHLGAFEVGWIGKRVRPFLG